MKHSFPKKIVFGNSIFCEIPGDEILFLHSSSHDDIILLSMKKGGVFCMKYLEKPLQWKKLRINNCETTSIDTIGNASLIIGLGQIDGNITILTNTELKIRFSCFDSRIECVKFVSKFRIVVSTIRGDIGVFSIDGISKFCLIGHKDIVRCFGYFQNRSLLISAGGSEDSYIPDYNIRLWDISISKNETDEKHRKSEIIEEDREVVRTFRLSHRSDINEIFVLQGDRFASISDDCQIILWGLYSVEPLWKITSHRDWIVSGLLFSRKLGLFLSCSDEGEIFLWDFITFQVFNWTDCFTNDEYRSNYPTLVFDVPLSTTSTPYHGDIRKLAWLKNDHTFLVVSGNEIFACEIEYYEISPNITKRNKYKVITTEKKINEKFSENYIPKIVKPDLNFSKPLLESSCSCPFMHFVSFQFNQFFEESLYFSDRNKSLNVPSIYFINDGSYLLISHRTELFVSDVVSGEIVKVFNTREQYNQLVSLEEQDHPELIIGCDFSENMEILCLRRMKPLMTFSFSVGIDPVTSLSLLKTPKYKESGIIFSSLGRVIVIADWKRNVVIRVIREINDWIHCILLSILDPFSFVVGSGDPYEGSIFDIHKITITIPNSENENVVDNDIIVAFEDDGTGFSRLGCYDISSFVNSSRKEYFVCIKRTPYYPESERLVIYNCDGKLIKAIIHQMYSTKKILKIQRVNVLGERKISFLFESSKKISQKEWIFCSRFLELSGEEENEVRPICDIEFPNPTSDPSNRESIITIAENSRLEGWVDSNSKFFCTHVLMDEELGGVSSDTQSRRIISIWKVMDHKLETFCGDLDFLDRVSYLREYFSSKSIKWFNTLFLKIWITSSAFGIEVPKFLLTV